MLDPMKRPHLLLFRLSYRKLWEGVCAPQVCGPTKLIYSAWLMFDSSHAANPNNRWNGTLRNLLLSEPVGFYERGVLPTTTYVYYSGGAQVAFLPHILLSEWVCWRACPLAFEKPSRFRCGWKASAANNRVDRRSLFVQISSRNCNDSHQVLGRFENQPPS